MTAHNTLTARIILVAVCVAGLLVEGKPKKRVKSPEEGDDHEGDIILSPKQASQLTKNGMADGAYRWTGKTVPYVIMDGFSAKGLTVIHNVIDYFNGLSCVSFVPRVGEADYVAIRPSTSGCSSAVGMNGGKQYMNLGEGCFNKEGTVKHEFLHTLGFWHMQSTWNRDTYVNIYYKNIIEAKKKNFRVEPQSDVNDYGVAYDYGSIMHYGAYFFSIDGEEKTIQTIPDEVDIGQRDALSASDVLKLKLMYDCVSGGGGGGGGC